MSSSRSRLPTSAKDSPGGSSAGKTEPYHHGNLRASLLEAALRLVEEVGVDGFSLRELARRAGVSSAAPYHHFRDKAALIEALAELGHARLGEASERALEGVSHPGERLSALGVAYVLYAVEHPSEFRVMFRRDLHHTPASGTQPQLAPVFVLLRRVLLECQDAGIRSYSSAPALEAEVIGAWSQVHGLATLIVDGPLGQTLTTRDKVIEMARYVTGGASPSDCTPDT